MDSVTTSWVLHAIKNTLGYEPVRQDILLHYFPTLHRGNITKIRKAGYKNHVVTFDAFIEPGKTREDKSEKIQKYLEMLEINLVPEDKNKPRITKDELAKVINLTKLIGSKL